MHVVPILFFGSLLKERRIVKVDLTNSYGIKPFLNINMRSPLVSVILDQNLGGTGTTYFSSSKKKICSNYDLIAYHYKTKRTNQVRREA